MRYCAWPLGSTILFMTLNIRPSSIPKFSALEEKVLWESTNQSCWLDFLLLIKPSFSKLSSFHNVRLGKSWSVLRSYNEPNRNSGCSAYILRNLSCFFLRLLGAKIRVLEMIKGVLMQYDIWLTESFKRNAAFSSIWEIQLETCWTVP